jgi:Tol biopolymer transport system component
MSAERRFEQELPSALAELATSVYPSYIEEALAVAVRQPRRPAWQFPSRWLPARVWMTAELFPRVARLGPALILVTLALLLAALLAAIVGSQPRLPEPFGPAANGVVAFSADGGAYVALDDGSTRLLIDGPGEELGLTFSLDGRRIAFIRLLQGREFLWAADADGSNAIQLLPEPLWAPNGLFWSPAGDEIAIGHRIDGVARIALVRTDGSGSRVLDLGFPATDPAWRPPDGRELIVRGVEDDRAGLYLVSADGSSVRPVGPRGRGLLAGRYDMLGAAWSPDGSQIAYHTVDRVSVPPSGDHPRVDIGYPSVDRFQVHIVSADGTDDHVLASRADDIQEGWPAWSPDGTLIATQRWREGGNGWLGLIAADGTGSRDVGVATRFEAHAGWTVTWAPDGSRILAFWSPEIGTVSIDLATGAYEPVDWPNTDRLSWQRVAPR